MCFTTTHLACETAMDQGLMQRDTYSCIYILVTPSRCSMAQNWGFRLNLEYSWGIHYHQCAMVSPPLDAFYVVSHFLCNNEDFVRDRIKLAYTLTEAHQGSNTNQPAATTLAIALPATPPQPSARTTRSGCHIHFPVRLNIWAAISGGGGGTTHSARPRKCYPIWYANSIITLFKISNIA
jgi:hypothetical protein